MGLAIERESFDPIEFESYSKKLQANLSALRQLLERPGFGEGDCSFGSELEMSIIGDNSRAFHANMEIIAVNPHPQLQHELNRFNLEYNLQPVPAAGRPFSAMAAEIESAITLLDVSAAAKGGRVVPIGILPTLQETDLEVGAITDLPRYHALNNSIKDHRKRDFDIQISGEDPIRYRCNDVTVEGANTSLQVHLRVNPDGFADVFNAAQLVTPMAVAIGANSPTLLGHRLWDETRIALFKQAVDSRAANPSAWRRAARVPFGHGWVRDGAFELFAENVALYRPLLPVQDEEDPLACVADGGIPQLLELRLHHGTVWQWNRAIYDPGAGGHLRIEFRALPSGPTAIDMAANAAFISGLTLGMAPSINDLLPGFPFTYAEYNFYRAAQNGLDANLLWPETLAPSPKEITVRDLIADCLPLAEQGLASVGVDQWEIDTMLGIIRARLETGTTAARWQKRMLKKLEKTQDRDEALASMLEIYLNASKTGAPVAEWSDQV